MRLADGEAEEDTALYLSGELCRGARISEQDGGVARAILRGEQPLLVSEEKQEDGTLWVSWHETLPPRDSKMVSFGSRSHHELARFLLRRLHERTHVRASEESIRRAQALRG